VVDQVGYLTYGTDAANMLFHVSTSAIDAKRIPNLEVVPNAADMKYSACCFGSRALVSFVSTHRWSMSPGVAAFSPILKSF
jgi:hypothetical protein